VLPFPAQWGPVSLRDGDRITELREGPALPGEPGVDFPERGLLVGAGRERQGERDEPEADVKRKA
jgi:hypothetical protein